MLEHWIKIRGYIEAYLYHLKDTTKHSGTINQLINADKY